MNPEAAKHLEAAIQKTLSTHAKSDKSYLWMAYWVIFEREADPEGLEGWLGLLKAGVSRASVVQTMIKSSEFYQRISGEESENQINEKLHNARMEMVKQLLPPAQVILDLGGYSSSDPRGALLSFGYPHVPQKLYILDFHPDKMMFPGPEWPKQFKY